MIAATKNTYDVYNRDAFNIRIIQLWFPKFRCGDFSMTDKHNEDMSLAIINIKISE